MPHLPSIMLYGRHGIGKTSAVLAAFPPGSIYWICTEAGALNAAAGLGISPARIPHEELLSPTNPHDDFVAAAGRAIVGVREGRWAGVAIDTISSYCEAEYRKIRMVEHIEEGYARASQALVDRTIYILRAIQSSGCLLVVISHEKDPSNFGAGQRPGGPGVPGKLAGLICHHFDLVLRCNVRAGLTGRPMRVFEHNSLDMTSYPTKDRWRVVADMGEGAREPEPMDLGAVVRKVRERQAQAR